MKWKFTISVNALIVFGFWLAGQIAVAPAYNYFVEYSETSDTVSLPVITNLVFSVKFISVAIPIFWLVVSIILMKRLQKRSQLEKIGWVQLHSSVSVLMGLLLFLIFALAGVLPFLKFGGLL